MKQKVNHITRAATMIALGTIAMMTTATAQVIRTTVDDVLVQFDDVQPTMVNGRVMVPARGVFEHMNASVEWNPNTRVVTARHNTDMITLPINSYWAKVNSRQVELDAPAIVRSGRTLVPLRFLSETLGADVQWVAATRTVEINTMGGSVSDFVPIKGSTSSNQWPADYMTMHMDKGTVIPFSLNQELTSDGSKVGDRFTANLETGDKSDYQGMIEGAKLEGHVDMVRAKNGDTPGVLGLAFDRIRLPSGQTYRIHGTLIGLDSKSVDNKDGRLTAKSGSNNSDSLRYVGYGAGAGALVSILTKGNLLTNSLIGGALGYLFGEIQKDPSKARNVRLESGNKFGVKLTRELHVRTLAIRTK